MDQDSIRARTHGTWNGSGRRHLKQATPKASGGGPSCGRRAGQGRKEKRAISGGDLPSGQAMEAQPGETGEAGRGCGRVSEQLALRAGLDSLGCMEVCMNRYEVTVRYPGAVLDVPLYRRQSTQPMTQLTVSRVRGMSAQLQMDWWCLFRQSIDSTFRRQQTVLSETAERCVRLSGPEAQHDEVARGTTLSPQTRRLEFKEGCVDAVQRRGGAKQ